MLDQDILNELDNFQSKIDTLNNDVKNHMLEIEKCNKRKEILENEILEKKKQLSGFFCIKMTHQTSDETIFVGAWSKKELIGNIEKNKFFNYEWNDNKNRIRNVFKAGYGYNCEIVWRPTSEFRTTTLDHIDYATHIDNWDITYVYDEFELGTTETRIRSNNY